VTDQLAPEQADTTVHEHAVDLRHVTDRIADDARVDAAVAQRSLEEALKFLHVAATATQPVSPSKTVDIAWHHFILFTRDYSDYCQRHLGRYIHHLPDGRAEGDPDAYRRTRTLIADRFGTVDEMLWPDVDANTDCEAEGNCKAGCSGS
jgi:hypothetical protein